MLNDLPWKMIPGVTGKFCLGEQNEAGQRLNELFRRMHWSQQIPFFNNTRHDYTWTLQSGQYQNQIDYILSSQRWRSCIQSAKTRPRADCGSDHQLLTAKFRFKLNKAGKTSRPAKYDLTLQWR